MMSFWPSMFAWLACGVLHRVFTKAATAAMRDREIAVGRVLIALAILAAVASTLVIFQYGYYCGRAHQQEALRQ